MLNSCVILISVVLPFFVSETCMERNRIRFSKHNDILSTFKWIFCKLKIIENRPILTFYSNIAHALAKKKKELMKVIFFA